MSFQRNYPGTGPYEEVWFCELRTGADRGLWIRYTLRDDAPGGVAEVWAMAFRRDGVRAHKATFPLSAIEPQGAFRIADAWIDATGAAGSAGPIRWSLRFQDRGLRHDPLPSLLRRLPVVTRQWTPAILDLRCSGAVHVGSETFEFEDEPGVVGHIWGTRNSLRDWAWSHCNAFAEAPDAVFEGISARLQRPLLRHKALSSFVLGLDGRRYTFASARQWLTNRARYGERRWRFRACEGPVVLEGEARLPSPDATARVEYTNTDGTSVFCSNSRLSTLRLRLIDPVWGIDRELSSRDAAFELGSRARPSAPLHLPAAAGHPISHPLKRRTHARSER